jgi:hypothetical protein
VAKPFENEVSRSARHQTNRRGWAAVPRKCWARRIVAAEAGIDKAIEEIGITYETSGSVSV